MTDSRQLSRLVVSAEDFAGVLQNLRDEVPPRNDAAQQRNLTDITSAIGELYRLSTIFQQLRSAFEAPQYTDRLYRIASDAALVANSAQLTLSVALGMVGRASPATHWMVWDDLGHRLQDVERVPLSMRLKWYHNLTEGLLDQLEGYPFDNTLVRIKASVQALVQQQKQQQQQPESPRAERPVISYRYIESTSTTPRPPARITMPPPSPRPRPRRAVSDYSDTPRSTAPPPVPEVPSPQSPPVTWSSTRTAVSSDDAHSRRTSQSSYDAAYSHWASYIFGGDKWRSRYRANQQQLDAVTRCKGDVQADAKLILQEDGFVPLESVHFSDNGSILTFYYRPQNGRARLLFTSLNPWGQEINYCNPLTRLRAFRDGSILKLCMASSSDDQLFWTWAELKFIYHERMVLFYSTFVALKRQDAAGSTGLPTALIEDPRDMEEELLFSGTIRDREMFHVLRLLQDRGSGVLRLEARSSRGGRDEVPIWTAFLTKYIRDHRDRDFFSLEGRGVVSMICPKPKPYIFVPEYGLPLMSDGNFALQFVKRDDAAHLIEIWIGLCTSGRRS